ncbi:MAG: hypothetical protein JXM79_02380 [Sedimentisphaerales bacterium]|nr:hypothetical protein [Sedimentisphaerales bacterium]
MFYHRSQINFEQWRTLAAICWICSCAAWATAAEVATSDGLTLDFGPHGEVVSCRIDNHELLRTGMHGGIFIADVKNIPARDNPLGENLSFEQIEAGNPIGWDMGQGWQLDRRIAHTGTASMRVSVHDTRSGSLAINVPVTPNTPYRVSLWLRTEGCAPSFYIEQYNAQGQIHRDYPQIIVSHGRTNEDWFQLSHSFTTAFFCREIRVRCNVWDQTGTAWLDDVSIDCLEDDYASPQQRVEGEVHSTPDRVEQICESTKLSLRLKTMYQAGPDIITVDGEIEDTSGRDRAVTVSFRLPIDALGWNWYNDIQNTQTIEDDMRYGAARLLDGKDPTQRRTIALYPFSAIGNGETALALAVPMDQPRVFRLCYDCELGYFVNYEFGLTQAAKKFPGKAEFQFFIYRIDPQWGFRSAAQRYYEFHPQFFVKRAERQGALGQMANFDSIPPSDVVVPVFADFNRQESVAANRRELVKLLRYTEFIGWWGWALGITTEQAKQKPTPEETWAHVEELAHRNPPDQVALSILNCAPHDRDGNRKLHWEYVPEWGGYNYLCNPDPEITGIGGKINRFTLTYEREVSEVDRFELDGMRFDNPVVFATDNFRREHFQWADHPLAFDHLSKQPVIPLDFSSFECAKAIADDMHSRGKLVGSNYTPVNYPSDIFRIHLLDIVESETIRTWPTNAKLALQRTLAHQKIVCMSAQEEKKDWPSDRIEQEMKQAMFYGTFYYLSTAPDLYNRWIPLTRRLANAGWEPITYARCPALEPMVERFGRFEDRNLHFTLRNESKEASPVELIIDANALDLHTMPRPGIWVMRDAYTHESLDADQDGPLWRINLTVPAKDTVVLRVATSFGLALDHLDGVPDLLLKAVNYRDSLREANVATECPDYETLIECVQTLQNMLTNRDVRLTDAITQFQSVTTAFSECDVQPKTDETIWWSTRLSVCTAVAQRDVSAALNSLLQE